jgi:putative nucleotidyltransferase with HDIG domain
MGSSFEECPEVLCDAVAARGEVLTVTESQKLNQPGISISLVEIPPFPATAVKTLQVISNDAARMKEVSDLISTDPALSSEVLRVVNSPFFGVRTEVRGILQATLLLGLERIKGLVVTIGMKGYLGDSLNVPALRSCWRHSLACAVIAEELAASGSSREKDVAYTAGIIHDIGRLGLAVAYPEQYASLLSKAEEEPCDILARERELFGIDHCEAGRALVLRWNLPREFADVASKHHGSSTAGTFDLVAIIRTSCMMADALGFAVARPLRLRKYQEIHCDVPKANQLSIDPEELTFRIAEKINSIESY